jgi:hypothetical protein
LADALMASEKRIEALRAELDGLKRSHETLTAIPPREWIRERITRLQTVLEQRTGRSALLVRQLLGTIRMEATTPEIGRPYYRARTNIDVLAIMDDEPAARPAVRVPGRGGNSFNRPRLDR